MSAVQSNLSAPQYGYDIVVGTTVASINSILRQYIGEVKQPEFTICYISNGQGGLTQIQYTTLVANAKGSDPFNVQNGADPATNSDIQNLVAAGFVTAFKARIGLPAGIDPANEPVVIFDTVHSTILYNQLCSVFTVVEYTPQNGSTPASWMNQSQPSGAPWTFQAIVALNLADTTEYSLLPQSVQQQITNLGSTAFSVQQLLFDLQIGALAAAPVLTGVPPSANIVQCLQNDFIGAYFTTMQQNGQPLLGCTIKQSAPGNATLALSDLQLQINPYVVNGQPVSGTSADQPDLYVLNYLCAVNGDALPPPALFTWNWVDAQGNNNNPGYDGVIAINRNTFATWLAQQLADGLWGMCMVPTPYVQDDLNFNGVGFSVGPPQQYQLVPSAPAGEDGFFHVLTAAYSQVGNPASEWDWAAYMSINCTYSVNSDVYFGNTQGVPEIKMVTSNNAWISINVEGGVTQGNFAAYTSTTVFQLAVDASGDLLVTSVPPPPPPPPTNVSQQPDVSVISEGFTAGEVNGIVADIQSKVQGMIGAFINMSNIGIQTTLNAPKAWIFPGGKTFVFENLVFSDSGDLVAGITYTDPA